MNVRGGGRLNYIDSIKFIVCVLVFVGHFYYGFYTAASKTPDLSKMVVYTHTLCRFFFSRVFTVSVFSFLSGYLISKKVYGKKNLIKKWVGRYFRFSIPLFFVYFFIMLCKQNLTSQACEYMADVLESRWLLYGTETSFTMWHVLKASLITTLFFGNSSFETPVWTLQPMYIGYVLTTLYWNICAKIDAKKKNYFCFLQLVCVMLIVMNGFVAAAVFLGSLYRNKKRNIFPQENFRRMVAVAVLLLGTGHAFSNLPMIGHGRMSINLSEFGNMGLALLFLICMCENSRIRDLLNHKKLAEFGRLSFPIYLLHMPIVTFCSCYMMMKLFNREGFTEAYLFTEIFTIPLVLLVAFLWNCTVQKLCDKITNHINRLVEKI